MLNWLTYINEETIYINLGTWISLGDIQINYGLLLDSLSMVVMVPVGIVTLAVLFYAIDYMRFDPNRNRFYIILSVFAIFMTVLVVSDNYVMMFIGWEFVGVISYLLISFWNTRIAAMKSALSAILLNRMGDTLFVICIGTMLSLFHAVDFDTIELLTPHTDTFILNLIAIMLLIAATAKSAQLGLHGWLLSAMEGWWKALLKFHYMREHPNAIWSSFLLKNSAKSKLLICIYILYGQSSGNFIFDYIIYKRSSETLREIIYNNFILFICNLIYLFIFSLKVNNKLSNDICFDRAYMINPCSKAAGVDEILNNNNIDKPKLNKSKIDFYHWLIGFTEGDGSFIINNYNKYLEFKITQSSEDAQVLFYIKKELGFGSVSKQDKNNNTHCYRVRDKEGLLKIINIFNGNLHLLKYNIKFKEFVNRYNETYNNNIILLDSSNNKVTLDNAWLSGFTDAEGCFTHSFINNKISIRYIISQKNEDIFMNDLALLLKGRTSILKKCGTTNLVVNYLKLINLIKYFNKYKLKTKKIITYQRFLWVYYNYKNKWHLKNDINLKTFIRKTNRY